MSDTPRTDVELASEVARHGFKIVSADFARQLERENTTLRNAQKICEDCDAPTKAQFLQWKAMAQELAGQLALVTSEREEDDILCEDGFTMSYHHGSPMHKEMLAVLSRFNELNQSITPTTNTNTPT